MAKSSRLFSPLLLVLAYSATAKSVCDTIERSEWALQVLVLDQLRDDTPYSTFLLEDYFLTALDTSLEPFFRKRSYGKAVYNLATEATAPTGGNACVMKYTPINRDPDQLPQTSVLHEPLAAFPVLKSVAVAASQRETFAWDVATAKTLKVIILRTNTNVDLSPSVDARNYTSLAKPYACRYGNPDLNQLSRILHYHRVAVLPLVIQKYAAIWQTLSTAMYIEGNDIRVSVNEETHHAWVDEDKLRNAILRLRCRRSNEDAAAQQQRILDRKGRATRSGGARSEFRTTSTDRLGTTPTHAVRPRDKRAQARAQNRGGLRKRLLNRRGQGRKRNTAPPDAPKHEMPAAPAAHLKPHVTTTTPLTIRPLAASESAGGQHAY